MNYFIYGEKEIEYLSKKDKKLGLLLERTGIIERQINPNIFEALAESIVSQQISSKAAETVWNRLLSLLGEVTPDNIIRTDIGLLQKCGMSMRKAEYIWGIAHSAGLGGIDLESLRNCTDEEVISKLTMLKGVGVWTAEMLLIFSLGRKNILSYNDLAIRRGLMKLYGLKELKKEAFIKYKKRYSPYATIASFYLWELAGQ